VEGLPFEDLWSLTTLRLAFRKVLGGEVKEPAEGVAGDRWGFRSPDRLVRSDASLLRPGGMGEMKETKQGRQGNENIPQFKKKRLVNFNPIYSFQTE